MINIINAQARVAGSVVSETNVNYYINVQVSILLNQWLA